MLYVFRVRSCIVKYGNFLTLHRWSSAVKINLLHETPCISISPRSQVLLVHTFGFHHLIDMYFFQIVKRHSAGSSHELGPESTDENQQNQNQKPPVTG